MKTRTHILASAATIIGAILVSNAANAQGVRVDPAEYDRVIAQNTFGSAPKQSVTSTKQRYYASSSFENAPVAKTQKHKASKK